MKRNPVLTRLIALLLLPIILLMAPISSDYFSQGPVLAGSPANGQFNDRYRPRPCDWAVRLQDLTVRPITISAPVSGLRAH